MYESSKLKKYVTSKLRNIIVDIIVFHVVVTHETYKCTIPGNKPFAQKNISNEFDMIHQ